jgi:hypothetical protein
MLPAPPHSLPPIFQTVIRPSYVYKNMIRGKVKIHTAIACLAKPDINSENHQGDLFG